MLATTLPPNDRSIRLARRSGLEVIKRLVRGGDRSFAQMRATLQSLHCCRSAEAGQILGEAGLRSPSSTSHDLFVKTQSRR
jgi:hypothetical protein